MGKFRLSKETEKKLQKIGQYKANQLAEDAKQKLTEYYMSLIDWFYLDYEPKLDNNGVPYYIRTFNLYRSYRPYKRNSHNVTYYGGIEITADKMKDYYSHDGTFLAESLLNKFIYNQNGTWHGGDWHGGYGEMASFNIYNEMQKYKKQLIEKYIRECSVK